MMTVLALFLSLCSGCPCWPCFSLCVQDVRAGLVSLFVCVQDDGIDLVSHFCSG